MIIDPREPVTAAALAVDSAAFYNPTDPVLLAWVRYVIADDAQNHTAAEKAMGDFEAAIPKTAAGQAAALQSVMNLISGCAIDEDEAAYIARRLQRVIDSVSQTANDHPLI